MECKSVSHVEARTRSFRIKVKAEDYEKAMSGETWPYRVHVRPYKHFKQRHEQAGGQFGGNGDSQTSGSGVSNQH